MNNSKDIIRLILADDFPVTRAGIRDLLRQAADIEIIGEACDGLEAQHLTLQLRPHITHFVIRFANARAATA